jgi:trehalose 2-sulfotransferase
MTPVMTGRQVSPSVVARRVLVRAGLVPRQRLEEVRRRLVAAGATRTLVLCATPRSGSTMLARLLSATGLVGRAEELFHERFFPRSARRRPGAYLATRARESGGAFAVKLHWDQLELCLQVLRGLRGASAFSDSELLAAAFPEPRYVSLSRDDLVAQAVSAWKVKTSGVWLPGRPARRGEPWFDFDGIDERVRRLREQTEAWRAWFATAGVEPLAVTYEQLVADPAAIVRAALALLGLTLPDDLAVEPRTTRQADRRSEEWIRRYRELAAARSDG